MKIFLAALVTFLPITLFAEQAADNAAPPPMPEKETVSKQKKKKQRVFEKQRVTTVHQGKNRRIEEYRIKGHLTKVKVVPGHGAPYYIYYNERWNDIPLKTDLATEKTPYWKLFSW